MVQLAMKTRTAQKDDAYCEDFPTSVGYIKQFKKGTRVSICQIPKFNKNITEIRLSNPWEN